MAVGDIELVHKYVDPVELSRERMQNEERRGPALSLRKSSRRERDREREEMDREVKGNQESTISEKLPLMVLRGQILGETIRNCLFFVCFGLVFYRSKIGKY